VLAHSWQVADSGRGERSGFGQARSRAKQRGYTVHRPVVVTGLHPDTGWLTTFRGCKRFHGCKAGPCGEAAQDHGMVTSVAVTLEDLVDIPRPGWENAGTFEAFLNRPIVRSLGWPDEVVNEWLWSHGRHPPFLQDYRTVDLQQVSWSLVTVPSAEFVLMPTGPNEAALLDDIARQHEHYIEIRGDEVARAWEEHGTWLDAPLLIDRALLHPPAEGLQVVEGRTRVGVLRGRVAAGLYVADTHQAWVGRGRNAAPGPPGARLP